MNKYAILFYRYESPLETGFEIERLLVRYVDIPSKILNALIGVKVVYQKENSAVKISGDMWNWKNSNFKANRAFIIEKTDYLFEAEDDNAAKLIYEVM